MAFLKRIGTEEIKMIVQVELFSLALHLNNPQCEILVLFQRGNRKVQTLHPATIIENLTKFNSEKLRIPVTLYYETKKKEYQPKMASLVVLMKHAKGIKKVGEINLDFSKFLNKDINSQFCNAQLQNCPDKAASLQFQISFESVEKNSERSKTPEAPRKSQLLEIVEENKSELVHAIRESIVMKQCDNCMELEKEMKVRNEEIEKLKNELSQKEEALQEREKQISRFKEDFRKSLIGAPVDIKEIQTENLLMREKLQEMLDQEYKYTNLIKELKKEKDSQQSDFEEEREALEKEKNRTNELYQQCFEKLSELQLKLKMRNTQQEISQKETQMLQEEVDSCHKKLVEMENDIMRYKEIQVNAMQAFLELGDSKIIDIYEKYLF